MSAGAPGVGTAGDGAPAPRPIVLGSWVRYPKDEVFEVCGALALAEALLGRLGRHVEAARMAAVFDLVEAGLTR